MIDLEYPIKIFPFLKKLCQTSLNKIKESSEIYKIHGKAQMLREKGNCTGVPMVLSGRLRIYKVSEDGREITLYRVSPGSVCILAAVCVLGQVEYDVIIEAEDTVEILMIPARLYIDLLKNDSIWQKYIFGQMASLLINTMETIGSVAFNDIEERLSDYLTRISETNNSSVIKTTHERIALDLGTAREVVSRNLKILQNKGIIKLYRGKIEILDFNYLKNR